MCLINRFPLNINRLQKDSNSIVFMQVKNSLNNNNQYLHKNNNKKTKTTKGQIRVTKNIMITGTLTSITYKIILERRNFTKIASSLCELSQTR